MASQTAVASPLTLEPAVQSPNTLSSPPPHPVKKSSYSSSRRNSSSISPNDESHALNALELEAIAAVHELHSLVKDLYVSDKLPRTPDLIYLNLTTSEGHPFCVELTSLKGWRVTSIRHDCMNGDIAHLDLHIRYFETMHDLMGRVSHEYAIKTKDHPANNPKIETNDSMKSRQLSEGEVDQESQTFT